MSAVLPFFIHKWMTQWWKKIRHHIPKHLGFESLFHSKTGIQAPWWLKWVIHYRPDLQGISHRERLGRNLVVKPGLLATVKTIISDITSQYEQNLLAGYPTHGRQSRMAMNAAQHKIVNLPKTFCFCSSVFFSVCVFSMWPKRTLLPVWPRDATSFDTCSRGSADLLL